jgi:4'-phosphopantetheinyl transferase
MPARLWLALLLRVTLSKSPINNTAYPSASVWLVDGSRFTDDDLDFFMRKLGPSEMSRTQRFVRAERRRQFLVGRMLMRFAIADRTGLAPSAIVIAEQSGGAPKPVLPLSGVPSISVSHSKGWIACGISAETTVGLDIEFPDPSRDLIEIGRFAFCPKEIAWLERQADRNRTAAFYRLWTLHEALYKMRSNAGGAAKLPELVDTRGEIVSSGSDWHSYELSVPGLAGALCTAQALLLPDSLDVREVSGTALLSAMQVDLRAGS